MKRTIFAALALLLSSAAYAGTIGPSCGSCFGGVYSLEGSLLSSAAGLETWQYTYTLDLRGVSVTGVSYVGSLAAKVTTGLVSVLTVTSPTAGLWSLPAANTNVNNAGCDGSGLGWICISYLSGAQMLTGASGAPSYSWVFDVTMVKGTQLALSSIQANFDPATGRIMSERISTVAVPEPGSLALLSLGLAGLGLSRRRKAA